MPGPALHHMIARRLAGQITTGTGLGPVADYTNLSNLLADRKNHPYLFLGCQGPDFLFFNMKDWPAGIGDAASLYYEVYDAIEEFKSTLKGMIPDEVWAVLDGVQTAADQVIQEDHVLRQMSDLFGAMGDVADALAANVTEWLKKFVSDFKLFDILEHPYRDGQDKGTWWWFDALHYRKTGRFAKALLDRAPKDSDLHLYALGYLTHFTADTVGHPYVNINDGGPYRNQSQRHKTGENYQDVFNHFEETGKDWNRSKIHALYNFNYTGTVSRPDDRDEVPDPYTVMPPHLANFIADTINQVFNSGDQDDNEYGKTISADDVDHAYRTYYRWLRSATDTGTLPKPIPYSLTDELLQIWNETVGDLDDIGDWLEDAIDEAGNFSFLGIFLALAALIAAAVAAVISLIEGIVGALVTLTLAGIRAALSLIYELLYNSFQMFRFAVSLNGLAFPMEEHLNDPRFKQFKNTMFTDPTGMRAADLAGKLPKMKVKFPPGWFQEMFEIEAHLAYPPTNTPTEPDPVFAAPESYFSETSRWYAFGDIPISKEMIDELSGFSGTEAEFKDIIRRHIELKNASLGNALMLTEEIYKRWSTGVKFPDFNLDADRGYAYTCWTQKGDDRENPQPLKQNLQRDAGQPITPVEVEFIKPF